jgi:DNA adenine methylase
MLIRYPGSKDKHIKFLAPYLASGCNNRTIVEPFAGTASVTFYMLKNDMIDKYVINDIDDSVAAMWQVVKDSPETLITRIKKYIPQVSDFYDFKVNPGTTLEEKAFRKIVLHQISYSGLGPMAGGPLGGKMQTSEYKIDARWRPAKLELLINETSALLNSVEGVITSVDWSVALSKGIRDGDFIYLDPPYYKQGPALYLDGTIDHDALAKQLSDAKTNWVLSYDDTEEVRNLYSFADVKRLDVTSHLHHKTIGDVVIVPKQI